MRFEPQLDASLPPLAWFARIEKERVELHHGRGVETGDGWVVEGVWDGEFRAGNFHETEAFWGSGLRVTSEGVVVVPSVAVTDRLVYGRRGDEWVVSNSLPLLLSRTGYRLSADADYVAASYVLTKGVFRYQTGLTIREGEIHQLFHQNLVISGGAVERQTRSRVREFANFQEYESAMRGAIERLASNLASEDRRNPLVPMATASSGYDSACVSVFARMAGARKCFTSRTSNSFALGMINRGADNDSGEPVACALGLEPVALNAVPTERQVYYRSTNCIWPELIFDGITEHLAGGLGVVFTGFYGDSAWSITDPDRVDSELVWHDVSGMSLCEGRLIGGYINVALPFLFGRSRASLARISASEEMASWRIGGDYDRPIPRRILEEAGVPRGAFGVRKKAVLNLSISPKNPTLKRAYLKWVGSNMEISPLGYRAREVLSHAAYFVFGVRDKLIGRHAPTSRFAVFRRDPRELMFRWAVETLVERYAR